LRLFTAVCEGYGWHPPYLGGAHAARDLLRLLTVVHHWGHEQCLARGTVAQYVTNTKHHYLVDRLPFGDPSPAWGDKSHHHPLVAQLLHSIPERHRPLSRIVTTDWIKDGVEHCWTTEEFVAIAFILGWILRVGEATETADTQHLATWGMLSFQIYREGQWRPLPMADLQSTPCDMLELHLLSRKYQHGPRLMPGRINTCHLRDPSQGTTQWCHLCLPTILQAWAITNRIDRLSQTARDRRPILARPSSDRAISAQAIARALRRLARQRHENEESVIPHCLRKTGITAMANNDTVTRNQDRLLRTVGHKSLQSLEPYVVPDASAAAVITAAQSLRHRHLPTPPLLHHLLPTHFTSE
jgi:hypothetical protein